MAKLQIVSTVIIDFDDTLCLTEAACFEMENETLVSMGRKPMSREVHIATWGQPLFEAITVRSPGIDIEDFKEAYRPIIAEYTRMGRLDAISAENYDTLDELIRMKKALFILTSRTQLELEHMLEPDHFLASRIKGFYHKGNTRFHKPDPRVFDELLRDHSLDPRSCIYIGDSLGDAAAAKQAGLYFVASLESGLRQKSDFDDFAVDAFIDRFPDIIDAIRQF